MKKSIKIFGFLILLLLIFTSSVSAGNLFIGMRGSEVKNLQSDLNSLGYAVGAEDGIFGNQTKQGVIKFQGDNKLVMDGIVGIQTLTAISNKLESNIQMKEGSYQGSLKMGMRGNSIKELQSNLKSLGYPVGSIDGVFGAQTKRSVIAFQKDNGLRTDGIVGPKTYAALQSKRNTNSTTANRGSNNTTSTESKINKVLNVAKSFIGVPYLSAGTTPKGFDCSGYTQYVLKQSGIDIPRTTVEQYTLGTSVNRSNLKLGDFVFFTTYKDGPSHVGIYVGNNSFIHASSSVGVTITNLDNSYWNPRYIGARRPIK